MQEAKPVQLLEQNPIPYLQSVDGRSQMWSGFPRHRSVNSHDPDQFSTLPCKIGPSFLSVNLPIAGKLGEYSDANTGLRPPCSNFHPKNVWAKVRTNFQSQTYFWQYSIFHDVRCNSYFYSLHGSFSSGCGISHVVDCFVHYSAKNSITGADLSEYSPNLPIAKAEGKLVNSVNVRRFLRSMMGILGQSLESTIFQDANPHQKGGYIHASYKFAVEQTAIFRSDEASTGEGRDPSRLIL